jgi:uncharacterized membrane protein YkvA (DUF1232 family)
MITRFFPILTKVKALKAHGRMLWHAFRHADTPKWIKGFMLAVALYLFSPIDIIPDFLVLFGITDDLVVISSAMWFLGKVIPEKVKDSLLQTATDRANKQITVQKPPIQVSTINSFQGKKSLIRFLGVILLVCLLVAALADIGALF